MSQRNKYLRQFPNSIKPSAEAASEVSQWVTRSQTKTLSPIDKWDLICSKPSVRTIDSAALYNDRDSFTSFQPSATELLPAPTRGAFFTVQPRDIMFDVYDKEKDIPSECGGGTAEESALWDSSRSKSGRSRKISRTAILSQTELPGDSQYLIESTEECIEAHPPPSAVVDFEDVVTPQEVISAPPPSSMLVSKQVIRAADATKEILKRLGGPSVDHLVRSRKNGSVSWKDELSNKLIKATEIIMG